MADLIPVIQSDYLHNPNDDGDYPLAKNFPDLRNHNNYLKNHLTFEVYTKYRSWETPNGWNLDQCIQAGVDDCDQNIGVVSCDEYCYDTFKDLFYPVLMERHNGYDPSIQIHPQYNKTDVITNGKFDSNYVLSCRIRAVRSIRGFSHPPVCSRAERRKVEKICKEICQQLQGDLKGEYHPLRDFSRQQCMLDCHKIFHKPTHPIHNGVLRDWPDARGIYFNRKQDFVVWVNEEDHLRIISMEKGGNMKSVYDRFCKGAAKMEEIANENEWEYQKSDNLGYIVTCPSNVGNGIRCSVHIKLPLLSRNSKDFDDKLSQLRLEKRELDDASMSEAGIYDVSNMDRLGKSSTEAVQQVCDGVHQLIMMEKQLE